MIHTAAPYQRPDWVTRTADQLVRTAADLRRALRRLSHGRELEAATPHAARSSYRTIRLTEREARTLLTAAMPVPQAHPSRAAQHAALLLALARAADALLDCAETDRRAGPYTVGVLLDLGDEIRAWSRRARWQQATSQAGVSWPAPGAARTGPGVDKAHSATFNAAEPERSEDETLIPLTDRPDPAPDGRSQAGRAARRLARVPVQRSLLLPIGTAPTPVAAPIAVPAEEARRRA